MAHKDEIQHEIFQKVQPAIVALTETRITAEMEDSEVSVPGYSVVRCDAENRNTGGVILYVRDNIKYELERINKIEMNCWCVAVEVKDKVYKGIIVVAKCVGCGLCKIYRGLSRGINNKRKLYDIRRF